MNKIVVLRCGLLFILLAVSCLADPTPDVSIVVKAQSSPLIYIKQSLMSIQRAVQQRNGYDLLYFRTFDLLLNNLFNPLLQKIVVNLLC